MNPIAVCFADLTHTGKTVDTNFFPLGVAYVAAYAKAMIDDPIEVQILKYPKELSDYLQTTVPTIAGFSNFSWNASLSYAYAGHIKRAHPETITVFGGPNYPAQRDEQEAFLKEHPMVDFYIVGEGEQPFVELYNALRDNIFSMDALIASRPRLRGVHYYKQGAFRCGRPMPRISDLSVVPSPILTGLMDKFIDGGCIPLVQTTRGCPYSCTYCCDGGAYQNKVARFPRETRERELEYLAERTLVPHICFADSNFGIGKADYETAQFLASLQNRYGWPRTVDITGAKNNKARIKDILSLLGGSYLMGASVQSTDGTVLEHVRRRNLPLAALVEMAKASAEHGGNSFSEIILGLPGDSKGSHFQSVRDMLDAGMDEVRMYQFILLPGTEAASRSARSDHQYRTRWRVLPRCFGHYQAYGKAFSVAEIHEVCVGGKTMSHQEYLDCRRLNMVVEIFNNGKMFGELFGFLDILGVARSRVIDELYVRATTREGALGEVITEFEADEEKNFFDAQEDLECFLERPGVLDSYMSGERGANQIMKFRALALLQHLEANTNLIFEVARNELERRGMLDEMRALYLEELAEFVLACKGDLLAVDRVVRKRSHFDFVELANRNFSVDPGGHRVPGGVMIEMGHSEARKIEVNATLEQYGRTADGLGHLMQRAYIFRLYREPAYAT